jgi:hypothetical protein
MTARDLFAGLRLFVLRVESKREEDAGDPVKMGKDPRRVVRKA